MIAGHEVVGVAGSGHGQQERVERIVGLDVRWQLLQHERALQVVDHRANAMRLKHGLELWVATGAPEFFELGQRGHDLEACRAPSAVDRLGRPVRRDEGAEQDVGDGLNRPDSCR